MRKILFIMSVFVAFGLAPAVAEQWDNPLSCGTEHIDDTDDCTGAYAIAGCDMYTLVCVNNNVTCSCSQCNENYDLGIESADGVRMCVPKSTPLCRPNLCVCCTDDLTDAACIGNATNNTITQGCSAAAGVNGTCMDRTTGNNVQTSIYCASRISNPQTYCMKGYWGLTANSASGKCDPCPFAEDVWSDSGHNNLVQKTTMEYLGVGSTAADCCLPKVESGNYYYDTLGRFTN